MPNLPILKDLISGGIEYGTSLLVEFEPRSIWYETSLTIAAQALRNHIRTEYHTFTRPADKIREAFTRLGLDVIELEKSETLIINDDYTDQIGVGTEERGSFKLSDRSIYMAQGIKSGASESSKRRIHIDDNTGVLLQYNDEKTMIDVWRTRTIPYRAKTCEDISLISFVAGVASESFYKKFEAMCDGIIDFKSEEKEGRVEQFVRVGVMRGRPYESRWRPLRLLDNGEVTLAD